MIYHHQMCTFSGEIFFIKQEREDYFGLFSVFLAFNRSLYHRGKIEKENSLQGWMSAGGKIHD